MSDPFASLNTYSLDEAREALAAIKLYRQAWFLITHHPRGWLRRRPK
jgi:hypothetical protein